jgi:hypothetical protein
MLLCCGIEIIAMSQQRGSIDDGPAPRSKVGAASRRPHRAHAGRSPTGSMPIPGSRFPQLLTQSQEELVEREFRTLSNALYFLHVLRIRCLAVGQVQVALPKQIFPPYPLW